MALRTLSAVRALTFSDPLMVRDTVAVETLACLATSLMFMFANKFGPWNLKSKIAMESNYCAGLFLEIGNFHLLNFLAGRSWINVVNLLFGFGVAARIRQEQIQSQPVLRTVGGPISFQFLFLFQIFQWEITIVQHAISGITQFPAQVISAQRIRR